MGYLLPRGGTIQGFETPNIILGILKYPKIIIGVRGGKCVFFYTRRGQGDARGISYQELGAIQGFETPIRI